MRALTQREQRMVASARMLESLSPLPTLARGYTVLRDSAGPVISQHCRIGCRPRSLWANAGWTIHSQDPRHAARQTFKRRPTHNRRKRNDRYALTCSSVSDHWSTLALSLAYCFRLQPTSGASTASELPAIFRPTQYPAASIAGHLPAGQPICGSMHARCWYADRSLGGDSA